MHYQEHVFIMPDTHQLYMATSDAIGFRIKCQFNSANILAEQSMSLFDVENLEINVRLCECVSE